jgi:hypothetical protein
MFMTGMDMFKDMGRNDLTPYKERTQPFMSAFEEDKMLYFGAAKNVDPGSTTHWQINICQPKAPPAPDPVRLDPNLYPLGGETTSTLVSKFSFHLYSDSVDRDPSVKWSYDTVYQNEYMQVVQGQAGLAASERRNTLTEWLVNISILLKDPNYIHDHSFVCTYKEVIDMAHRENEADTVMMNHYHGEPPDSFVSGQHMIIDIIMPSPTIKTVPSIIHSKCYHNMAIKPSVSVILCHCILDLISMRNSKESTITPTIFVATGNFVDKIIHQRNTLKYNGSPNRATSEAAFLDGTTSSSSLKRTHNPSTHHHVK